MKKIVILITILLVHVAISFAQDNVIYLQKGSLSASQYAELQRKGAVIDEITVHTDASLTEKITSLSKNWTREGMNDLLEDFKISPNQFGVVIDTLSSVVITQSNDIPNTNVGKIALVGFAWKIAGPSVFRFLVKIVLMIFVIIFFCWSYKKNFRSHIFVLQRKKTFWRKTPEKQEFFETKDLIDDNGATNDTFDTEVSVSGAIHWIGGIAMFLLLLFL